MHTDTRDTATQLSCREMENMLLGWVNEATQASWWGTPEENDTWFARANRYQDLVFQVKPGMRIEDGGRSWVAV